ncbi:MAG: HlyD family type I secretion periplasmic adaptor subunit [Rhodospirillales bacterium]|nr:HlyD family type I secretion periplasmic adaptor subunit [Rhodospirillales bacterium]
MAEPNLPVPIEPETPVPESAATPAGRMWKRVVSCAKAVELGRYWSALGAAALRIEKGRLKLGALMGVAVPTPALASDPPAPGALPVLARLGRRPEGLERADATDRLGAFFFWLLVGLVAAALAWLNLATLDIVSMTQGEIIPSTQVKTIQHLEGGIVLEIPVREGQPVEKGQELVVLESTVSGADVAELDVRLTSLSIDIKRLEAEVRGAAELRIDEATKRKAPEVVQQAIDRFRGRRQTQESRIASQQQLISQRQSEIREIQARTARNRETLQLQEEHVRISEQLLKDQLTSRVDHLTQLKALAEVKGAIEQDTASLARVRAALEEALSQLTTIRSAYTDEVRSDLNATQLEYTELLERQKKFDDSLRRTVLRSPVAGIIKTLYVTTVGGVIRSGDKVVDIVPGEDRLIVESRLPTTDIGYVQVGQSAVIKLTSADAARFGQIEGRVVNVSPDAMLSPDGAPYYKVRIETERAFFERGRWKYYLFPGMRVMANIRTGERTVMQYLIDPYVAGLGNALQER